MLTRAGLLALALAATAHASGLPTGAAGEEKELARQLSRVAGEVSEDDVGEHRALQSTEGGGTANNCVRNCEQENACTPTDVAELSLCRNSCDCVDAPPPTCSCDQSGNNLCFLQGDDDPDGWCLTNADGCDPSVGCYWDDAAAAVGGTAVTGSWLPNCAMFDVDPAGESARSRYDAVCEGPRVLFTGFMADVANGEYRAAEQPSSCPDAPAQTIYKLWGSALDLYLYRTKRAWHIGPDLCSPDVFFARISTDEGADIAQSSLFADGGDPLAIECQPGFEGTCGWRECIDEAVITGGVPTCLRSSVPNNAYGWMRMVWNRAVRLQSAADPTNLDITCLGDFDDDGRVTVVELMEVLAGFGMQTCALRADLNNDCAINVPDVLILLSQFGECSAPTSARVAEYARSELFLSGFADAAADGVYNTNVFDRDVCASGVLVDSLDQIQFAPQGVPICMRETGQVVACSSAMVPNNFTVYKSVDGATFLYPSRDASMWIVGNQLCRDDIGYAYTPINRIGVNAPPSFESVMDICPTEMAACNLAPGCEQELLDSFDLPEAPQTGSSELLALTSCFVGYVPWIFDPGMPPPMPCDDESGTLCTWRTCSAPQFFGSSCELDCPDDAGRSRDHNRNCPPLMPTTSIVIAAIGTHSDTSMSTQNVHSVASLCSGYTLDPDDPETPEIDEAAMTPLPSTRYDCEARSGTWSTEMIPFVAANSDAPSLGELEAMCPVEYLACMAQGVCEVELSMVLSSADAPPIAGSESLQAVLMCVYTSMADEGPCPEETLACLSSTSCTRLLHAEGDLAMDECQANEECAAFMHCNIMLSFEPCSQQCTEDEILTMVSGTEGDIVPECLQCIGQLTGSDSEPGEPVGDCAGVDPVCVESDLAALMGGNFADATQGCQCCFMTADPEAGDPFFACLGPMLPPADFCVDPGNAVNNPDVALYECRHSCETGTWDDQNAAGCHGDNSGNRHEDQICVTEGVYEPGQMQPWGEACCEWCGDMDGDGSPDYQGCCEGMRADGEMGCEDTRCEWTCNGINCFEHGEDQPTCEANNGVWESNGSCEQIIGMQGMMAMQFAEQGLPESFGSTVWLGEYGDLCCTGYEPSLEGTCDNDVFVYDQVIACDEDPDCSSDSLVAQLSPECLGCLIANEGPGDGPPPIEPCLTGGGGGDGR